MTRVVIGAALFGVAVLAFVALRLALPRSADLQRSERGTEAQPKRALAARDIETPAAKLHDRSAVKRQRRVVAEPPSSRALAETVEESGDTCAEPMSPGAVGGGRIATRHATSPTDARHPLPGDAHAPDDATNGGSAMTSRTLPLIPVDASTW